MPPEIASTLAPELQRWVGYDFGGLFLGFVEAGNSKALLGPAGAHDMARTTPASNEAAAGIKPIPVG